MVAAIEGVEAGAPPAVERMEQLPLLPSEQLDALPADLAARTADLRAPRKAGRPLGATNRSTQEWRDYFLSRYTSPLVFLGELYSRATLDLARELGCKPREALEIQERAAAKAAEFVHAKMPVSIAMVGALPMIELVDPNKIVFGESEEIQQLIDLTDSPVEQPELNSPTNVEPDQGDSAQAAVIADHSVPEPGAEDGTP